MLTSVSKQPNADLDVMVLHPSFTVLAHFHRQATPLPLASLECSFYAWSVTNMLLLSKGLYYCETGRVGVD